MAVEQESVHLDKTQKRAQDRAQRAMRRAAKEKADAAEVAQTSKATRSAKIKLLEDKPWAKGFERLLGDDGKPIQEPEPDAKGPKKRKKADQDGHEGKSKKRKKKAKVDKDHEESQGKGDADGAQTVPKQSTPAPRPRPVLARTTLDSDDEGPLSAAKIVVPPKRIHGSTKATGIIPTEDTNSLAAPSPTTNVAHAAGEQTAVSGALPPILASQQEKPEQRPATHNTAEINTGSTAKKSKDQDLKKSDKSKGSKKSCKPKGSKKLDKPNNKAHRPSPRSSDFEEEESSSSDDSGSSSQVDTASGSSGSEYSDDLSSSEDEVSDEDPAERNRSACDEIEQEIQDLSVDDSAASSKTAAELPLANTISDEEPSTAIRTKRTQVSAGSGDEEQSSNPPKKRSRSDRHADAIERPTFPTTSSAVNTNSTESASSISSTAPPTHTALTESASAAVKAEDIDPQQMPHHGRTLDSLKQWEARFDPITRLVWSTNREVRLTDQTAHIAQLMRAAMNHVAALVAFDCALYLEPDRSRLQREIILDQAIALGSAYTPIVDRLKNDFYYMEVFVKAVEQRNANLRTNMKKYTDSQVVDEFKLVRGECEDHVKALLVKQAYAYPGDILQGTLDGKNPFYRALVIKTLQIHFFTSTAKKPSVSSMFPERFTSSDRYKADELEIPIPMLALTCAMIKLSLDLWRNGRGPTVKEDGKRNRAEMFALTACREEYTKVLELIDDIREGGPRMYHRVMHDVYLSACGSSPIVRDAKRDDDPRNRAVSRVIFDPED